MIRSIISFSLEQKIFFNLVFTALIIAGSLSLLQLPTERYPNINYGQVNISTYYSGASPQEVETQVTLKIEKILDGVKHIEWIRSVSYQERSDITLKFKDDTRYEEIYDDIRFRVQSIQRELPDNTGPSLVEMATVNDFTPVIEINLLGEHENYALSLVAKKIKASLKLVPGVLQIKLQGEYEREYHIFLDLNKMKKLGVSYNDISQSLKNTNISVPAGSFTRKDSTLRIRVNEEFDSRKKVMDTIIRKDRESTFVRIADIISHTELSYHEPTIISSVNGVPSLSLQIIKTASGNAINIKKALLHIINGMKPQLDEDNIQLVLTQDSTLFIQESLKMLVMNMLVGILLVGFVIWLFMDVRSASIIIVGIPFSFLLTMLFMNLTGNSLNEISLFAFILISGIIVDDAIIVTENIYRHIQSGSPIKKAIIDGISEVALPVITATMTTVAAFLPMLMMTGSTGDFFSLIPITVSFALLASLIECLIILPIHYLDWGSPQVNSTCTVKKKEIKILRVFRYLIIKILTFTLHFRKVTIAFTLLLFVASIAILSLSAMGKFPFLRIQFFPDDYRIYYINIESSTTTPVSIIDKKIRDISSFILSTETDKVASITGYAGYKRRDNSAVLGKNYGTITVSIPPRAIKSFNPNTYLDHIQESIQNKFSNPKFNFYVQAQKEGPATGKDLFIRILGDNTDSVEALADNITEFIYQHPRISSSLGRIESDRGLPRQVINFQVNHEAAREYGLTTLEVANMTASVLDGRLVGHYKQNNEAIDLKLFIDPKHIKQPSDALNVAILEHTSYSVYLNDLVKMKIFTESDSLTRYQRKRAVNLSANLKSDAALSTNSIALLIKQYYQKIQYEYPETSLDFNGQYQETQRSYISLAYASIIAIMFIYLILATQFQSYLQPFIILSAIMFSLIGVIFGKYITQSLMTINGFIALVGVAGVVVNDALLLISFFDKNYQEGLSRRQSIYKGIRFRLRPIILTTLTTSLGLLPMALGIPYYSLVWGNMASTFVTGLTAATLLTLVVLPVFWDLLIEFQEKKK